MISGLLRGVRKRRPRVSSSRSRLREKRRNSLRLHRKWLICRESQRKGTCRPSSRHRNRPPERRLPKTENHESRQHPEKVSLPGFAANGELTSYDGQVFHRNGAETFRFVFSDSDWSRKGFSVKENFHRIASKMHTVKGRTTNEHEETRTGTADYADSRR
jgi:hypothetical protein